MVKCGVAVKLDKEAMFNKEGQEVFDINEMYGRKTKYHLIKPEDCIYVDETGCNTNMTAQGQIGGTNYIFASDNSGSAPVGLVTDLHFTVLCFSSGTGVPVLCAIILKSDRSIKDIPLSWKYGVDEQIDLIPGDTKFEILNNNVGEGKAMAGGPKCFYKGKTLPCFIGASPNSSITSELLAKMLEMIDSKNLFDRSNGNTPFLLLDGHHSRFMLPFLEYINNPATKWTVNIGVPYGTHLWQVADSAECNSSFKLALAKSQLEYVANNKDGIKESFYPSDIVPLVRMAWSSSFARHTHCKRAIAERGWGPLNYVLLDHLKIKITDASNDEVNNTVTSYIDNDDVCRQLNFSGSTTNILATVCVENRMKNKAKNDLYLKEKENQINNKDNRQKMKLWLKNSKNWRSGKFATLNQYQLTDDEILFYAKERQDDLNREKQAAESKKTTVQKKR